jgi:hypothetical protein
VCSPKAKEAFGITRLLSFGSIRFYKICFQGDVIASHWYKYEPKNIHQVLHLNVRLLGQ